MTEPLKRSRGRPKGSGRDDSALLAAVADLLLAENIKRATAMKRVIRQGVQKKTILETETASTLRRLQEKWGMHHVALSAEAQARLDARKAKEKEERERQQRRSYGGGGYLGAVPQVGGVAFPRSILSGLDPAGSIGKAVEAAGFGRLTDSGLGSAVSRLASAFPSSVNDLGIVKALNKPAHAWETTALQEAAQSLKRQEQAALNMNAAEQVYGTYLANRSAASQVLGEVRHPWEETREQEAMRKMMTGTYDPITGQYK